MQIIARIHSQIMELVVIATNIFMKLELVVITTSILTEGRDQIMELVIKMEQLLEVQCNVIDKL